jgi:hypothetical protein
MPLAKSVHSSTTESRDSASSCGNAAPPLPDTPSAATFSDERLTVGLSRGKPGRSTILA